MDELFLIQIGPSQVYNYSLGEGYFDINTLNNGEASLWQ